MSMGKIGIPSSSHTCCCILRDPGFSFARDCIQLAGSCVRTMMVKPSNGSAKTVPAYVRMGRGQGRTAAGHSCDAMATAKSENVRPVCEMDLNSQKVRR